MKIYRLLFAGFLCAAATQANAQIPQIQHVVFIIQENRTPDNLFHNLPTYLPAADIASSGINSLGQIIPLVQVGLSSGWDIGHEHADFQRQWDRGKMDGANKNGCTPPHGSTCPPNPQFTYVNPSDIAPYYNLAINYGFANRMFQTNQSGSFPAHQMLLAGTSQLTSTSPLFGADNMRYPAEGAGCAQPSNQAEPFIGPGGKETALFPCMEHDTLTDVLDNPPSGSPISWRYYYYAPPTASSYWDAPNAVQHMCVATGSPLQCTGPDWSNGKMVANNVQFLQDIQSGHLAAVSWVTPSGYESDHPADAAKGGPSWVASIVNAIGNSPYWYNTVILITWDDWGGFYDHVAPPIDPTYGYFEYGFRVPLLVVSAYTPQGYVSNVTHDFGSMLKFTEKVFGLGLIPPGTFADARADDLSDFFNFNAMPRAFTTVAAPMPASHFLQYLKHDPRPPLMPDTDD